MCVQPPAVIWYTYVKCFKLLTGKAGKYFMCLYILNLRPGDPGACCVTLPRIVRHGQLLFRDDQPVISNIPCTKTHKTQQRTSVDYFINFTSVPSFPSFMWLVCETLQVVLFSCCSNYQQEITHVIG